ncbi:hypothetical protein VPH35_108385 [Triticum aestivum]
MGGGDDTAAARSDLGDFLKQLDLNDDDFADVDIDDDDPAIQESVRWLAIARVHTSRSFNLSSFYKDMRAAWNPAQDVRFRPVVPNHFVVQASCLGDWERIMNQGPWLFRNMAVLLCLYDGFSKAEEVEFFHVPIWLQIHIVEKLLKDAGEILDMRFNECGLGIHDEKTLKFGDWIYADAPNMPQPEGQPTKATCKESKQAETRTDGRADAEHVPHEPEVMDTASSPIKKFVERLVVDTVPKRRPRMDEAGVNPRDVPGALKALLAITDGKYNDHEDGVSPTNSSSSSKRLEVTMDSGNNEISAASCEEDHRTQ